ncbi:hypothetical protein DDB_G0291908 [Dictyostelium discoideum AX4]|uniref:THUMP domain-containing protein n=1 Tax=Dictyostelium discoideum TaxID=44689 RepID=Q54DZ0_DICDI|nr:hypothetical protein DDB_G0291908 [Dictyostelium discoideum AX4]EAL61484.1 hypothetical protein DDB_G0291908 [Dictyostelium discoideum AX4]|eukprot:XP_629906.1 hypothetical protein DDB_G0291908 [Dictyostelium discoideum AX4]
MSENNELKRKIENENDENDENKKKLKDNEKEEEEEKKDEVELENKEKSKKGKKKEEKEESSLPSTLKPSKAVLNDPIFGQPGLLFTFGNGREVQATKDLYNLLNEYVNENNNNNNNKNDNNDDFDFNKAFEQELQQVKETTGKSAPYKKYTLKCNGIAFMAFKENSNIDPISLTSRIFKDCETSKTLKTKEISRLIPISKFIHLSNMMEEIKILIDKYFCDPIEKIIKYKIEFKSRNNEKINKMEYIQEIAKLINPNHKVDLNNPELTIIIEIIKFYCGVSIVSNYNECKRFNLVGLAGLLQPTPKKKNKENPKQNNHDENEKEDEKEDEREDGKESDK